VDDVITKWHVFMAADGVLLYLEWYLLLQGRQRAGGESGRLRSGKVYRGKGILSTNWSQSRAANQMDGHREHDRRDLHHKKWRGQ